MEGQTTRTETVRFNITGEFVTETARRWYWEELKPYSVVKEFLDSATVTDELTDEEHSLLVRNILFYKARMIGETANDTYDYEEVEDSIPSNIAALMRLNDFDNPAEDIELLSEDIIHDYDDEEDYYDYEDEEDPEYPDDDYEELDPRNPSKSMFSQGKAPISDYDRVILSIDDRYLGIVGGKYDWVNRFEDAVVFPKGIEGVIQINNFKMAIDMIPHLSHLKLHKIMDIDPDLKDFVVAPNGELRYVNYMSHEAVFQSMLDGMNKKDPLYPLAETKDNWITAHRPNGHNNIPGLNYNIEEEYIIRRPERLTDKQIDSIISEYAMGRLSLAVMKKLGLHKEK